MFMHVCIYKRFSQNTSGTLDYGHNPFQENARNPKHSHIKASFPIVVNGNENNLFRIDFNGMQYGMWPEVGGVLESLGKACDSSAEL